MLKKKGLFILILLIVIIVCILFYNKKIEPTEKKEETTVVSVENELDKFRNNKKVVKETNEYNIYELEFLDKGKKIYGQLYLPNNIQKTIPLVIICHGFESDYEYCSRYAEYCINEGIAAYVFDFWGGSSNSKSGGNIKEMSVNTELEDLETVFYELQTYNFINRNKIFLMGESQGGLVSAIYSSRNEDSIAGLILLYPAFEIPDDARRLYKDRAGIPNNPTVLGVTVGKKYYEDVIDMDIYMEILGYHKPVLIIHGDQDVIAPISYSESVVNLYSDAKLITIQGSNHGFEGDNVIKAGTEAVEFIKSIINN